MRYFWILLAGFVILGTLPLLAIMNSRHAAATQPATKRAQLEERLRTEGRHLIAPAYAPAADVTSRRLHVPLATLADNSLYLVQHPDDPASPTLLVEADGRILTDGLSEANARVAKESLDLLVGRDGGLTLFADGVVVPVELKGWHVYWATAADAPPVAVETTYPTFAINDGFMRTSLTEVMWKVESGDWSLHQHGGGMPTTDDEMQSYNFQRAVNPFTVIASGNGVLACGDAQMINSHVEARLFLGQPRMEKVIDVDHLPTDTNLVLMVGDPAGRQVGFGWFGGPATDSLNTDGGEFRLVQRDGNGPWQAVPNSQSLPAVSGKAGVTRPPVTNWVKVALELHDGGAVVGLIDDEPQVSATLDTLVAGPFRLASGHSPIEFDDVRGWSLPAAAATFTPVFVKSRLFAGKTMKDHSDPDEFQMWARGSDTFLPVRTTLADGKTTASEIVSRQPLFGDWTYESAPHDDQKGDLPDGLYAFTVYAKDAAEPLDTTRLKPLWRLVMAHDTDGWYRPGESVPVVDAALTAVTASASSLDTAWPLDRNEFTLRFRRLKASGDRIELFAGDAWHPVSAKLAGPLHVGVTLLVEPPIADDGATPAPDTAVADAAAAAALVGATATPTDPVATVKAQKRLERQRARRRQRGPSAEDLARAKVAGFPAPEHHQFAAENLVQEFFEAAPSDWSWVSGAFRMDARWACQNQWNFMACASTSMPFTSSKRTFYGDQEHEFYMSLRPNMPWDVGDTQFQYDSNNDPGFRIFGEHEGWYTRHDLNFSFCSDGRNPLSGYALIYAGEDNTKILLLRRGVTVASSDDVNLLISRDPNHHVIHWRWWDFRVCKYGARIIVYYSGNPLFDYTDPEPLDGGHIGFWSIRNGFTISRVTSMASRIGWEPEAMSVPQLAAPYTGGDWAALHRDTVQLSASTLSVAGRPAVPAAKVSNTIGGGFFATRWRPATPVDLTATPVLELPLQLDPNAKVNLHLDIGGESYIVRLTSPLAGSRSYLTARWEIGEQFRLPLINVDDITAKHLLGEVSNIADAGRGMIVKVDLGAALDRILPGGARDLRSLTIGNTSNDGYLMAGNGGNQSGATYTVATPVFTARGTAQ